MFENAPEAHEHHESKVCLETDHHRARLEFLLGHAPWTAVSSIMAFNLSSMFYLLMIHCLHWLAHLSALNLCNHRFELQASQLSLQRCCEGFNWWNQHQGGDHVLAVSARHGAKPVDSIRNTKRAKVFEGIPKFSPEKKNREPILQDILTQPSAFSPKNRTQDNNRSQPIFLMQFSSYWILGSTSLNDYWAAVTAQKLVEEVAKMLAGSLPRSVRPIVLTPTINSHTNNRSQPAIVLRKQRNVLRNQKIQETFSTLSIVLSGGGLRFESSMKFQKSSWEGCSLRMGKVVIWSFKMPPRTFSAIIVLRWIFELYWICRWSFPSISPKGENVVVGSNGGLPTINLSSACFQRTLQFR